MAAHGSYDGFLRPHRHFVPYMPAIHDCPWCESSRFLRGPLMPPLAQGPLMQHGSCSDACNHLFIRERVYLQRHVNDRFDHDINHLTNTMTRINRQVVDMNRQMNWFTETNSTDRVRVGRAIDIIEDLIERVQDLEARERRSRSPRRNEQ